MNKLFKDIWEKIGPIILSVITTLTIFTANGSADTWPKRIMSISPALTEILFAIGAGPRVFAVDNYSTYPPEAPVTSLSSFEPNMEAMASFKPDLWGGFVASISRRQVYTSPAPSLRRLPLLSDAGF